MLIKKIIVVKISPFYALEESASIRVHPWLKPQWILVSPEHPTGW
jgi:hypothetical protein